MATQTRTDHVDVLIVGAGISGIGAAYHLKTKLPHKTFTILEARDAIGGTWDLFRYPGIRSDSDLHTFAYEFKPWTSDNAIADAHEILDYLHETVAENGIGEHIRFGRKVVAADFSHEDARWTVQVLDAATGETSEMTANVLFSAAGYYDYAAGYRPTFAGEEDFTGQIIHPQAWPEDLDYTGKRVVVIGSGATAVTLVPAMADKAAQMTMLQRSPSYVVPLPGKDIVANTLRKVFSEERAYRITRRMNIGRQRFVYAMSRKHPNAVRKVIRWVNARSLPEGYDVDVHFKPSYDPWDQRLCAVRNGDMFRAIRKGKAEVVTDRIARFTPTGILLESGRELEADIVVTATGLNLLAFGGMELTVDGAAVELGDQLAYKSLMLSNVPNFAFAIGYTNSSWTLKVDLVCDHLCRILAHMDARGYDTVEAVPDDPTIQTRPLMDFSAGYVQRSMHLFPKQGDRGPWTLEMSYAADHDRLRKGPVEDPALRFATSPAARRGELVAA